MAVEKSSGYESGVSAAHIGQLRGERPPLGSRCPRTGTSTLRYLRLVDSLTDVFGCRLTVACVMKRPVIALRPRLPLLALGMVPHLLSRVLATHVADHLHSSEVRQSDTGGWGIRSDQHVLSEVEARYPCSQGRRSATPSLRRQVHTVVPFTPYRSPSRATDQPAS